MDSLAPCDVMSGKAVIAHSQCVHWFSTSTYIHMLLRVQHRNAKEIIAAADVPDVQTTRITPFKDTHQWDLFTSLVVRYILQNHANLRSLLSTDGALPDRAECRQR